MNFANRRSRSPIRLILIIAGGFVLGGLLTELMAVTLPPSAARQFFITTVAASLQPLAFDLKVLAFTLGPIVLRLNVLSVVGVVLAAWFARSLL
ncbi:DUF4321 domain-containing protein [Candidatus Palauibacter sp.]|uniref:DUF4321 domain-containing protein n=1 Tax=Candidatus Palauibacter sp. TaxID=3101350 RepID=UPI003B51FC51